MGIAEKPNKSIHELLKELQQVTNQAVQLLQSEKIAKASFYFGLAAALNIQLEQKLKD